MTDDLSLFKDGDKIGFTDCETGKSYIGVVRMYEPTHTPFIVTPKGNIYTSSNSGNYRLVKDAYKVSRSNARKKLKLSLKLLFTLPFACLILTGVALCSLLELVFPRTQESETINAVLVDYHGWLIK